MREIDSKISDRRAEAGEISNIERRDAIAPGGAGASGDISVREIDAGPGGQGNRVSDDRGVGELRIRGTRHLSTSIAGAGAIYLIQLKI